MKAGNPSVGKGRRLNNGLLGALTVSLPAYLVLADQHVLNKLLHSLDGLEPTVVLR